MAFLFFAVFGGWVLWVLVIKPWRLIAVSPDSDVARIKRDYEGQGREVVQVRRAGSDWGGRYTPAFRKYLVTVRRHDGETADFTVGVAFGFSSDADLTEYDAERRKAFFKGSQSFF